MKQIDVEKDYILTRGGLIDSPSKLVTYPEVIVKIGLERFGSDMDFSLYCNPIRPNSVFYQFLFISSVVGVDGLTSTTL